MLEFEDGLLAVLEDGLLAMLEDGFILAVLRELVVLAPFLSSNLNYRVYCS